MTFTHALGTNNYGSAKFIVDASAANGTHTTIAAALTSASSGDTIFIRPGTYTENLTLKAGVNLAAYVCDAITPNVIILGKCTMTTAGTVTISGVQLKTNSDFFLAVTGSADSVVNLINCDLNVNNNNGISYTSSGTGSGILMKWCSGDTGTTGIAYFVSSGAGIIKIFCCAFENHGQSLTNSTISAGVLYVDNSKILFPTTSSSTAAMQFTNCQIIASGVNSTMITHNGSANNSWAQNCKIASGTSSAISIGATFVVTNCDIQSTNTNAITGAGTITYQGLTFSGTSSTINTTTQSNSGTLPGSRNTAPSAGLLGEQIRATVAFGTPVSLSNNTQTNVTSISLTAGIWDVTGIVGFQGATTGTVCQASISTTSATGGTRGDNSVQFPFLSQANIDLDLTIPSYRLTLTTTTTVYLVAFMLYTVGTGTTFGRISATRVG